MTRHIYKNFLIVLAIDVFLVAFAWYFANLLRFNFDIPLDSMAAITRLVPIILGTKMVIFYLFDLYKGMWRYTSMVDLLNIIKASGISSLLVVTLVAFTHGLAGFARAAFIIDWGLTIFLIAGYRLGIRLYFWLGPKDRLSSFRFLTLFKLKKGGRSGAKKLLILGAGDCGEKIYREIQDNAGLRYEVVGFLDDDLTKVGKLLHGVPILGTTSELKSFAQRIGAEETLIAIPSATSAQMRALVARCEESGLPSKTVRASGRSSRRSWKTIALLRRGEKGENLKGLTLTESPEKTQRKT